MPGTLRPTLTELPGIFLPEKSRTVTERIADGEYEEVNGFFAENPDLFVITHEGGPVSLWTAHFDAPIEGEYVEEWAASEGFGGGYLEDVLAVGAHPVHGNLEPNCIVVGLQSKYKCRNLTCVPCIHCIGARTLQLPACKHRIPGLKCMWDARFCFLLRRL